jgi:hypothetical protein
VNIESKAAAAGVVPKRNQVVDPLLNNSSAKSTAKSSAKSSTKSSTKSSSDLPCFDAKRVSKEHQRMFNAIVQDLWTNWLTKLTTCGGETLSRGHSLKIKMNGTKFSPDGQRLLKAGGTPTREHRVRTQTIGKLINRYDPINPTILQTSRFSKLTKNKYILWFKQFMALHRPGFKFTSIQVNVNTTSAPHVDGGNSGPSIIIGGGNYTGGRTVLWPSFDRQDSTLKGHSKNWQKENMPKPPVAVDISTQTLRFDGDKTWHASETFTGMRWSFVFFTMKEKTKNGPPTVRSKRKRQGKK